MAIDDSITIPIWRATVHPMSPIEIVKWIEENDGGRKILANHNLHSMYLYLTSLPFRKFYSNADRIIIDGFPIWLVASFCKLRVRPKFSRVGSNDWISELGKSEYSGKIAVVGAKGSSNSQAIATMRLEIPLAKIEGWNGFDQLSALKDDRFTPLHDFRPDLVLLGIGMPDQELFLLENWDRLPNAVYATVGGAIDHISGEQKRAPRFLQVVGLEWMWRLINDPSRLWKRYLVEPILLLAETCRAVAGRGLNDKEYENRVLDERK